MHGPRYGSLLVLWEVGNAHKWTIVGYSKARQILTAQQRIMAFLRKMTQILIGEGTGLITRLSPSRPVQVSDTSLMFKLTKPR